ncbi:hypothetical protein ACLM5H_01260 [Fredinandcohnia humi]
MRSWLNDLYYWEKSNNDNDNDNNNENKNKNTIKDADITDTEASVNQSGNSDVDVNVSVNVDTMPIALAILYQSLLRKEISNEEFELAANKLMDLTDKYRESKKKKDSKVRYFNNDVWRR